MGPLFPDFPQNRLQNSGLKASADAAVSHSGIGRGGRVDCALGRRRWIFNLTLFALLEPNGAAHVHRVVGLSFRVGERAPVFLHLL